MDKIEGDEQALLLENLRSRLTELPGLNQGITLYHAAPKIVLDTLEERIVPSDLQHWNNKFIELESLLWDRLQPFPCESFSDEYGHAWGRVLKHWTCQFA